PSPDPTPRSGAFPTALRIGATREDQWRPRQSPEGNDHWQDTLRYRPDLARSHHLAATATHPATYPAWQRRSQAPELPRYAAFPDYRRAWSRQFRSAPAMRAATHQSGQHPQRPLYPKAARPHPLLPGQPRGTHRSPDQGRRGLHRGTKTPAIPYPERTRGDRQALVDRHHQASSKGTADSRYSSSIALGE